ncbi:MAG: DUF488 family protein [Nitrososphaeraceae archaeon]
MIIKVERIYDNPKGGKSFRILVDRLWPRGLSKDKVRVDLWLKDIAPSNTLRNRLYLIPYFAILCNSLLRP